MMLTVTSADEDVKCRGAAAQAKKMNAWEGVRASCALILPEAETVQQVLGSACPKC